MDEAKVRFARKMIASATLLARVLSEQRDLFVIYFARGYQAGGADAMTDESLSAIDVSAADVAAGITLAENLPKFLTGQASYLSDYEVTLARLREDA